MGILEISDHVRAQPELDLVNPVHERFFQTLREMVNDVSREPEIRALRIHKAAMASIAVEAGIAKQMVLDEIRAKFRAAFPNRYYVFLVKRPRDTDPWPVVFTDHERAENYEDRFGPVVEVRL